MIEQIVSGGFLHFDVGEEFLAGILQTGPKEVDYIIDNQEAIMVTLAIIDSDWRILLVMALHVELLLLCQLASVDRGADIGIALAEQGEGRLVDVVVDEDDGLFRLFDEVGYLHVGIKDLPIVEDALYWWQRGADEEIDLVLQLLNL